MPPQNARGANAFTPNGVGNVANDPRTGGEGVAAQTLEQDLQKQQRNAPANAANTNMPHAY